MKVLLGVTGGIAAYKACSIISGLKNLGYEVQVIMTKAAQKFITPLTFATLSERPVMTTMWSDWGRPTVEHIEVAKWCDVFVVAPATANTIAKFANGIADNLLSTVFLALPSDIPKLIFPAMHFDMLDNEATKANIAKLGVYKNNTYIFKTEEKKLACGDVGYGALLHPRKIVGNINEAYKYACRLKERQDR